VEEVGIGKIGIEMRIKNEVDRDQLGVG